LTAENAAVCRRDGKQLYLVKETEKLSNGVFRVTYSLKCPLCGYAINVERVEISFSDSGSSILVKRSMFKKTR